MIDKFERRLKKLEEELIELKHQIEMQNEKAIDDFWDMMADEAEAHVIDSGEKWR